MGVGTATKGAVALVVAHPGNGSDHTHVPTLGLPLLQIENGNTSPTLGPTLRHRRRRPNLVLGPLPHRGIRGHVLGLAHQPRTRKNSHPLRNLVLLPPGPSWISLESGRVAPCIRIMGVNSLGPPELKRDGVAPVIITLTRLTAFVSTYSCIFTTFYLPTLHH